MAVSTVRCSYRISGSTSSQARRHLGPRAHHVDTKLMLVDLTKRPKGIRKTAPIEYVMNSVNNLAAQPPSVPGKANVKKRHDWFYKAAQSVNVVVCVRVLRIRMVVAMCFANADAEGMAQIQVVIRMPVRWTLQKLQNTLLGFAEWLSARGRCQQLQKWCHNASFLLVVNKRHALPWAASKKSATAMTWNGIMLTFWAGLLCSQHWIDMWNRCKATEALVFKWSEQTRTKCSSAAME